MDRPRFRACFLHPRFWPLWLGFGLLWLVVQLPYGLQLKLGRALGWLMYRTASSRRQIAARNLELCFPGKSAAERERLLKENFAYTGIAFFEMAMSWWWPRARLAKLAHVEGLEQGACFVVRFSGGNKGDIHAAHFINFVIFDFRENDLFLDTHVVVATTIEGISLDTAEIAHARQCDVYEAVEEFVHFVTAQGNLAANGLAFAQLECSD